MPSKYRVKVNVFGGEPETVTVTADSEEQARHIALNEVVGDAQVAEIEKIEKVD